MTIGVTLALGAVIGVLLGLLGGGGSILAVPALVYVLGLGIEQAIPISLIVVGIASAVGALPKIRARQVQWRLAAIFAVAGIPATFVGTAIGRQLPQPVLLTGFAVVMVVAGIRMLQDNGDTGTACKVGDSGINWRRCVPRSVSAGLSSPRTTPSTAHIDIHIEVGINPQELTNSWQAAFSSAASFTLGAVLPWLAIPLPPPSARIPVTVVAVLLALAVAGWISARPSSADAGRANPAGHRRRRDPIAKGSSSAACRLAGRLRFTCLPTSVALDGFGGNPGRFSCGTQVENVLPYGGCAGRWGRDSNPHRRLCRPLPRHSATPPWPVGVHHTRDRSSAGAPGVEPPW